MSVTNEDGLRVARALVGQEARPEEIVRWQSAVASVALPFRGVTDDRLWSLARRGAPWTGLVDAGLALTDPWSPVRHRLYLMLAVLEASPAHVSAFEARDRSVVVALLALAVHGTIALLRSAAGLLVVSVARALPR